MKKSKFIILFGNSDPVIRLSATSVAENTPNTTTFGTASIRGKYTGTPSWTLTDASGTFAINSGTGVYRVLSNVELDYEINPSLPVTFSVADVTPTIPDRTVDITITNVLEVTLGALTLDDDTRVEGSVENTVVGALVGTSGGTLSLTDDAGGRFKLSGQNIVAGATATAYDDATSHNITVRETHADGNNSPRDSVIAITITEIVVGGGLVFGTLDAAIL
jgi:hypothetical protein